LYKAYRGELGEKIGLYLLNSCLSGEGVVQSFAKVIFSVVLAGLV